MASQRAGSAAPTTQLSARGARPAGDLLAAGARAARAHEDVGAHEDGGAARAGREEEALIAALPASPAAPAPAPAPAAWRSLSEGALAALQAELREAQLRLA